MAGTMTDRQFATLRRDGLRLVSTLFDGTLLVNDQYGVAWLLAADGSLHRDDLARRAKRVRLDEPPAVQT